MGVLWDTTQSSTSLPFFFLQFCAPPLFSYWPIGFKSITFDLSKVSSSLGKETVTFQALMKKKNQEGRFYMHIIPNSLPLPSSTVWSLACLWFPISCQLMIHIAFELTRSNFCDFIVIIFVMHIYTSNNYCWFSLP